MTRAAWERTITDSAGNVLTGVQITVFQSDGVTVATIYDQQSGGAAKANPFSTGVQTSAKFYADPGRYVVRAFKDGLTKEFTDVDIADKAVRDDLGSAAYLTATASATDSTAGRALRVGDHGNGTTFRGVVDVLGAQTPAQIVASHGEGYVYNGTIQNHGGATPEAWGVLSGYITSGNAYSYTYQEFTGIYAGKYRRTAQSGGNGWNPWVSVYDGQSALGSVSFSGGANTGAIIERGSNANGDFIKFADGTAIAWGRVITLGVSINAATYPNIVTGFLCDPNLPVYMVSHVISLAQHALYDDADRLIYSIEAASSGGMPMILSLGTRPDSVWPRLDEFGAAIASKVDYFWSAIGRWR